MTTLIGCHERTFDAFGGVLRNVLYDNMKTFVLERFVNGECQHRYHTEFLDFAKHSDFNIKPWQPYWPKTKGKVERFNDYLLRLFYVTQASCEVANVRGKARRRRSLPHCWRRK